MMDSCMDISLANIHLRLRFSDASLCRRCATVFGSSPGGRRTSETASAVLDVRTNEAQPSHSSTSLPLDGYGEYNGVFDPATDHGFVVLTGSSPAEALANCVRGLCSTLVFSNGGLVLHAACLAKDSHAWLFAGPSGAGKSTICDLSPQHTMASDDLTAVTEHDEGFRAWGLPDALGPYEIKGVFVLVQDTENSIVPLTNAKGVAKALALPRGESRPDIIAGTLAILDRLTQHVPVMELHFRKDPSFWECVLGSSGKEQRAEEDGQY